MIFEDEDGLITMTTETDMMRVTEYPIAPIDREAAHESRWYDASATLATIENSIDEIARIVDLTGETMNVAGMTLT